MRLYWWRSHLKQIIHSRVRYTKLDKSLFIVGTLLGMGRSLYTVLTLVSKVSFSLRKMSVDFLVYRAIDCSWLVWPLLSELLMGKNHENHLHSFAKNAKKTSLRTADLSPCSSPLRDVLPPRETSLNSDERGETSAVRRLKKNLIAC